MILVFKMTLTSTKASRNCCNEGVIRHLDVNTLVGLKYLFKLKAPAAHSQTDFSETKVQDQTIKNRFTPLLIIKNLIRLFDTR